MSVNQIIIEGTIEKGAEVTMSASCKTATMVVSVNRTYKTMDGQETTDVSYFDVVAFGESAECVSHHAVKGKVVRIVGRLKQERWKDAEGKNCSKVVVVAEHISFVGQEVEA